MKYADYDPDNLERSGNIHLAHPEGYKPITREVDEGAFEFVCQKCGKLLDRWYNGEWVSENPSVTGTSGYLISQLNAAWVSASDLKRKELNSKSRQTFYNYVLGEPYQDLSLSIVPRDVVNMRRTYLAGQQFDRGDYSLITVGIDWGVNHSVVVTGYSPSGAIDIIRMFSVPESNSLADINADVKRIIQELRLYEPDLILADLGYQGTRVNQLINAFGKDKVYGVKVNPSLSKGEVKPSWSDITNTVTIDKLTNNIAMVNMLKSGDIGIWSEDDDMQKLFTEHLQNIIIRDEEDERTGDLKKIITRKGGDHLGQALMMDIVGLRRLLDDINGSSNTAFKYTEITPPNTSVPSADSYYGGDSNSSFSIFD